MITILTVLLYSATGLFLLALVIWWAMAVGERLFATERTPAIGSVEIIGGEREHAEALKAALPSLVISELNSLTLRTNAAIRALKEAAAGPSKPIPADLLHSEIDVPGQLKEEIKLELKIADVDVGGLLSWIASTTANKNQLDLTIVLDKEGKNAWVSGHSRTNPLFSFSSEAGSTPREIVKEIAGSILQIAARRREKRLELLATGSDVFEKFINALAQFTILEQALPIRVDPATDDYITVLESIEAEADLWKGWLELQWLAAKVSERALRYDDALRYYGHIREYGTLSHTERDAIDQKISELNKRQPSQTVASTISAATSISTLEQELLTGDRFTPIWSLIGMTGPISANGVKIGVVGPHPSPELVKGKKLKSIGQQTTSDEMLHDYTAHLINLVSYVVTDASYVVVGSPSYQGSLTLSDLIEAVHKASVEDVDVLLFAYSRIFDSKILVDSLTKAAERSLVVVAAGNEGERTLGLLKGLTDEMAVSSAVDLDGRMAAFSSTVEGALWAPGVDIPLIQSDHEIVASSGTSWSAAIIAGVAAGLKAEDPEATPTEILAALKQSGSVVNFQAALKALQAIESKRTMD